MEQRSISIHALRVEGDPQQEAQFTRQHNISIHALRVEGDTCIISLKTGAVNISIHALRVEGDITLDGYAAQCAISIHALRVEGDIRRLHTNDCIKDFYPRPPGGGRHTTLAH